MWVFDAQWHTDWCGRQETTTWLITTFTCWLVPSSCSFANSETHWFPAVYSNSSSLFLVSNKLTRQTTNRWHIFVFVLNSTFSSIRWAWWTTVQLLSVMKEPWPWPYTHQYKVMVMGRMWDTLHTAFDRSRHTRHILRRWVGQVHCLTATCGRDYRDDRRSIKLS